MKLNEKVFASYLADPEIIGIMLVGSGSRAYKDLYSDYDIEIVCTDNKYAHLEESQRLEKVTDEDNEYEILLIPQSDFEAKATSKSDIDHWPYEECQVLYDPLGRVAETIRQIVFISEDLREKRIKIHYFEFLLAANKAIKAYSRNNQLNVRLSVSHMCIVLNKLIFMLNKRWPPAIHWTYQNLVDIRDLPQGLVDVLLQVQKSPEPSSINYLISIIDAYIRQKGLDYCYFKEQLVAEISSASYREVRECYEIL